MKLDQFLQLFVVKEKKFYPLYKELGVSAVDAAEKLLILLQESHPEQQTGIYKMIRAEESKADKVRNKLFDELNNTFVTPFDREDVHRVALSLDTFIDYIHDSARRVVMYNACKIDNALILMGKYIVEDAQLLLQMMEALENLPKSSATIAQLCNRIGEVEHSVDDLFEHYMTSLFANEKDAIELVKLKNIVQGLEDATDKAKDASDSVRNILIKLS